MGVRYWLIAVCVAAQAATLIITWSLWEIRKSPPHLPAIDLPQISFGGILAFSLALILFRPQLGIRFHIAVLVVSFLFDQWRLQPQVIGIAVMMIAVVEPWGPVVAKSYLTAMWFWSGLHKLLSPDWLGHVSWDLLQSLPIDQKTWHAPFAYTIAFGEILLAVLAILRPRWAAVGCVLLHSSIALFLSPWVHDRNISVIPWNLCTAVVGFWILTAAPAFRAQSRIQWAATALLFILPAGFYAGWIDRCFAHVLYSHNVPYGLITRGEGLRPIAGWGSFRVPFPNTRRLFRQYFEITVKPGSKLHLADPRKWLPDVYFLKRSDGEVVEIDRTRFLSSDDGEIAGVESDDPRDVFALSQAGARMLKRTAEGMIYAVEIAPSDYRAELLRHLHGLPNTEQLQLGGCDIVDNDLLLLLGCDNLQGIGLNDTKVTNLGLRYLAKLPRLDYLELDNTATSAGTKPPHDGDAD
jgi:methylamine utilization protein MauE